jgi:hypothetical protein
MFTSISIHSLVYLRYAHFTTLKIEFLNLQFKKIKRKETEVVCLPFSHPFLSFFLLFSFSFFLGGRVTGV